MDIILRESERLNALITDFLLFAQPPRTNKDLEDRAFWRRPLELFVNSPEYHEDIRIIRPHSHGVRVMIDPDQMKQVFWNLLINAAQSMSQGGELRLHLDKRDEGLLANPPGRPKEDEGVDPVSIIRFGCGIANQRRKRSLSPF